MAISENKKNKNKNPQNLETLALKIL